MGGPLLEAEGVTKRYGGLVANDAVTMTLQPGEVRGLIGPNGAGKTTFVNLLTGFETLDAGRISLGGTDLTGLPANQIAARGLVRTFQVARVFANMSVRENLLLPFLAAGSPGGVLEGQARARELLAASTLEHMAEEPAGVLSGGQRMLLQACAGFMIPSARLYVLDEPFAGINPVVKDTLIALIERENKSDGPRLPDRQPRDGHRAPPVPAGHGDDPGPSRGRGHARRGRPAPGGGPSLPRKRRGMSVARTLEVSGLSAGYVPGVEILSSVSLTAAEQRRDARHRAQRRRQVDAPACDLRHPQAERGPRDVSRQGRDRRQLRARSRPPASAT